MVNVLDCDTEVNEFEFQSPHYVHFGTNTFGKGINLFTHPHKYELNSTTTVLLQG